MNKEGRAVQEWAKVKRYINVQVLHYYDARIQGWWWVWVGKCKWHHN